MISRRTALALADCYVAAFLRQYEHEQNWIDAMRHEDPRYDAIDSAYLHDYLFAHDYELGFLEAIRSAASAGGLRDFIMYLHTGQSVGLFANSISARKAVKMGQDYLFSLARHMLVSEPKAYYKPSWRRTKDELVRSLELDGYSLANSTLLLSEESVLDEQEERGILRQLVKELGLADQDTGLQHLDQSADNFVAGRWSDSIGQSRKFLEYVLREAAARHHIDAKGVPIRSDVYSDAGRIPKYLQEAGLVVDKEKAAIGITYGLLSEIGAHPYMPNKEQARLSSHLALTFAQFVLLSLKGYFSGTKA